MKGPSWRRKDIDIYDPQTNSTIKCNLWGNLADQDIQSEVYATISNLETNVFKSALTVNTTQETTVSY